MSTSEERAVPTLWVSLVDWNAMSIVRDDKSTFVAAQGTMGTSMESSLFKPNRFDPVARSIPERNAWLDPPQEVSIDRIQPR